MILSNKEKHTFSHGVIGNTEDFGSSILGSSPNEKAKENKHTTKGKIMSRRKVANIVSIFHNANNGHVVHTPHVPTLTPTTISSPLGAGFNSKHINNFKDGEKVELLIGDDGFIFGVNRRTRKTKEAKRT